MTDQLGSVCQRRRAAAERKEDWMGVVMVRQKVKDDSVEAADANPYVWMGLAPGSSRGDVKRADRRLAMHAHHDHARL